MLEFRMKHEAIDLYSAAVVAQSDLCSAAVVAQSDLCSEASTGISPLTWADTESCGRQTVSADIVYRVLPDVGIVAKNILQTLTVNYKVQTSVWIDSDAVQ